MDGESCVHLFAKESSKVVNGVPMQLEPLVHVCKTLVDTAFVSVAREATAVE